MKTKTALLLACIALALTSQAQTGGQVMEKNEDTSAQTTIVVIGYCNRQQLIDSLPATAVAKQKIAQLRAEYEEQYAAMLDEYNEKVKTYVENNREMMEPIKLARQAEITERESRMNIYRKRFLEHIEKYASEQMTPIETLVDETIRTIAGRESVTILFDQGTALYLSEACRDITPLVREALK